MRVFAMVVVGLVAAGVQAQTASSKYAMTGPDCPGALRVQHQPTAGAKVWWTVALEDKDRKDQSPERASMGVHVVFESEKTPPRSVELSVSYLPLRLKAKPVPVPSSESEEKSAQELKKTFALAAEDKERIEGDLMVGPASTITHVHLISATFADGAVWRAPSEDACSVPPDLYMPVEAKK